MLICPAPGEVSLCASHGSRRNRWTAGDIYIMALDKATVAHIATLARIKLPEAEQDKIAGELSHILGWIEQLAEIDTSGVEPMTSLAPMSLPMGEDVVSDGNRH